MRAFLILHAPGHNYHEFYDSQGNRQHMDANSVLFQYPIEMPGHADFLCQKTYKTLYYENLGIIDLFKKVISVIVN